MPDQEKKRKYDDGFSDDFFNSITLAAQAERDATQVVDTPVGSKLAETEDGATALAKELGSRFVNAFQMGRTGGAVGAAGGGLIGGPPGAAVGGATGTGLGGIFGFTMEPSGNELTSDLPATLVEMLFPATGKALTGSKYKPVQALGKMLESGLGQAVGVGGAVATINGRGDQILMQVGGNLLGQGGNKLVRTFQSAKNTDIGQIRASSSSATQPLEELRQLTADEAIKLARSKGFDIPAGGLQEIGRPDLQREVLQLARQTGGGTGRLGKFAAEQDQALTKLAETSFGPLPPPTEVERAFKTMLDLTPTVSKTGNINLRFGNNRVATMSPNQYKLFTQIAGEGKSYADLGKRLIKPGVGGLEGIEQIQLVRKVAKQIDPTFDAAVKRDMFEALWGKSQLQMAGEGFAKTDVTQGGKFLQMINKMDPARLEAAFDQDGAKALLLLGKVANAIDPSIVFAKNTDLAEARFLFTKLGFTAASTIAGAGAVGGASAFAEDDPSTATILARTALGGLAGLGMFVGLGNLASRAVTNPGLAKALNQMSDSAGKAESGVRAILTDAFSSGNVAIDPKTGKTVLYPFAETEDQEEKEPNPIEQMMLQGNML